MLKLSTIVICTAQGEIVTRTISSQINRHALNVVNTVIHSIPLPDVEFTCFRHESPTDLCNYDPAIEMNHSIADDKLA